MNIFMLTVFAFTIILNSGIHSLKFNNGVTKNYNLTDIMHAVTYKSVTNICIITHVDFNDFMDIILKTEQFSKYNKYILTGNITFPSDCDCFLVFEIPNHTICNMFLKHKKHYLNLWSYVVILNSVPSEVDKFNHCSSVFNSANVIITSIENNNISLLSSPLKNSRSFVSVTPEELIQSIVNSPDIALQGSKVNVITIHVPPFTEIWEKNGSIELSGLELLFFKDLMTYYNFTWNIITLDTKHPWGRLLNGTLVGGVIQTLRDGIADMIVANLWQRHIYLADVEFSPPLHTIYLGFMVRRPHELTSRWQSFSRIFTIEVLAATFLAYLVITFSFWWAQNSPSYPSKTRSLLEIGLVMFGILTSSSSYNHRLTTFSTRSVILWWYFFSLLFLTALMSSIVTQLTLPLYSPRIDAIKQLVQNGFYWVDPHYESQKEVMKNAYFNLNDFWQMQFESKYKSISSDDLETYLKSDDKITLPVQTVNEEFVKIKIDGVDDDLELSQFRVMDQHLMETYSSFGFRKHSPFSEPISRALLTFLGRGNLQYWCQQFTKHKANRKYLLEETDVRIFQKPEQLPLWKLSPIFIILITGHALASIVFFIELIYFYCEDSFKHVKFGCCLKHLQKQMTRWLGQTGYNYLYLR